MTELQRLLIRGSEKVIGHYQFLFDTAKSEHERELLKRRIEKERQMLNDLLQGSDPAARAA
ncbi:hypothetical protein AS156_39860 [Bradyrhizobium macuxiense]|uniref:Uncharacterized protein n=1 Tax=Bradyrhizobium macuxiense TaxID=1755647 RepID=A0A109JYH9_9BRAD|nr:hypothetical protein [Bradyrhizobium macuxiense]KWV57459.1 hypothetical protein AS156_39860 [Bradyrhizobium macuxiense]